MELAIDFAPGHHARARDPLTSINAAERAKDFAATHAGRIHQALQTHGPRTAHELSQLIGLSVVQIDRRLPDLKAAGKARVVQMADGGDRTVNGFRLWRAI